MLEALLAGGADPNAKATDGATPLHRAAAKDRKAVAELLLGKGARADEPNGTQDRATSDEIMHLFTRLNQEGITIIMVTHEHDVAAFAGRQITFKDGRIIGDTKTNA